MKWLWKIVHWFFGHEYIITKKELFTNRRAHRLTGKCKCGDVHSTVQSLTPSQFKQAQRAVSIPNPQFKEDFN